MTGRTMPPVDVHVLTWDPVCQRSVSIAAQMNRPLETIHYLRYRRPALAPVKYPLQWAKTLASLRRRRPQVVMVSNPPPFAAVAVAQYCALSGAGFVIDAHTGVFLEPKWRPFLPLNRFLMRRALLTLVTNEPLRRQVEAWGAKGYVLPDPLPDLAPDDGSFDLDPTLFNVAAIFSFYEDEPVAEMLEVSRIPADMHIYVTGNPNRVPRRLRQRLSEQLTLTGFVPRSQYESLLRRCDGVAVFCTKPYTLLCGAYEAVAAGKPLLTSESEAMRGYFRAGTLFVDNTRAGIEGGLRELYDSRERLADEMRALAPLLRQEWNATFDDCLQTIAAARVARVHDRSRALRGRLATAADEARKTR